MPDDHEEYDRGHVAGGIDARLAGHDRHFEAINGNIARVGDELHEMKMAVQRLADQAVARDATVVTTAAALKDAEDARRDKSEQTWSPIAKLLAILGSITTVVAVAVSIYLAVRPH
jgi:hypothetical protein